MDNFYEQLENKEKITNYKIIKTTMYVFAIIAILSLSMGQIFPCMFSIIVTTILFFVKTKVYVEYEYVFTNGAIDIDVIYEQKKRKTLLSFNAKDMALLAEAKSSYVKDFSNKPDREISCFQTEANKIEYVAMITGGTERLQFRFTPDEGFLDLCYKYNPRAVKKAIR